MFHRGTRWYRSGSRPAFPATRAPVGVEVCVVANHRAKDHLVVAPLGAAEAAGHERLQEYGAALRIPARRDESGRGQVAVEKRLGMARLRGDLAEEEPPPALVLRGRDVALHDVNQFVVHRRVHALGRRARFEGARQRRDVEDQRASRSRVRVRIAEVGEVLEQDRRALGRQSSRTSGAATRVRW